MFLLRSRCTTCSARSCVPVRILGRTATASASVVSSPTTVTIAIYSPTVPSMRSDYDYYTTTTTTTTCTSTSTTPTTSTTTDSTTSTSTTTLHCCATAAHFVWEGRFNPEAASLCDPRLAVMDKLELHLTPVGRDGAHTPPERSRCALQ